MWKFLSCKIVTLSLFSPFSKKTKIPFHIIILELVKHTDATASPTNGYQSYAQPNESQTAGDGGSLLSLICGSLCKDTPFAEMFGANQQQNDNFNNNTAQPLMAPIQNGEHFRMPWEEDMSLCLSRSPYLWIYSA